MSTGRIALTRPVSPHLAACELTHVGRVPVDVDRARAQHAAYEEALEHAGCQIHRLPALPGFPDSVFVEDTLLVLPDVAVVTRPGAQSRRGEVDGLATVLHAWRPVHVLEAPATLDGGDVLRVGDTLIVGLSSRTSPEGVYALEAIVAPFGYRVTPVQVTGCLHLKSAATLLPDGRLLVNPAWLDPGVPATDGHVAVHPTEPFAANVLTVDDIVIMPAAHLHTRARLEADGLKVRPVDLSELAKAEGGVTCCSVIFEAAPRAASRSS